MLRAGPGAVVATEQYALAGHDLARKDRCAALGDRWAPKGVIRASSHGASFQRRHVLHERRRA